MSESFRASACRSIRDRYTWTQSLNVLLSAVVPLTAMGFLDDHGIIANQIITTAAQIAVVAMAIQLSAVSLEDDSLFWHRARKAALAVCVVTWIFLVILHPEIRRYSGLATAFFLSMLLGEMSAIWRGKVINSKGSRYSLLLTNLFASISRLLCFFLLLQPLGALESFIWSATFSNLVRIAGIYLVSRKVEVNRVAGQSTSHERVNFIVRLGAFFERSPTALVVVVLTSLSPLWGMELRNYALALPLMNISAAIASVSWTRFENVSEAVSSGAVQGLAFTAFVVMLLAVTVIMLMPTEIVQAESIINLKRSPVTLVAAPILFGFSTGLAVFTYGKFSAIFKVMLISAVFAAFGSSSFTICAFINIIYFVYLKQKTI